MLRNKTALAAQAATAAGADVARAALRGCAREKLSALDTSGEGLTSAAEITRHGAELER